MGLSAEAQGLLVDRKKENIEPWRSSFDGCKGSLKKLFWSSFLSAGLNVVWCTVGLLTLCGMKKKIVVCKSSFRTYAAIAINDNIVNIEALP